MAGPDGEPEVSGLAGSATGQSIYMTLREHGLTLGEWARLHPADRRFLKLGRIEYTNRKESESPDG